MENNLDKIRERLETAKELLEKGEQLYHLHDSGYRITDKPMSMSEIVSKHGPVKKLESSGSIRVVPHNEAAPLKKDATDDKIQASIRAAMDKKKFGEADATKHIIDRDRGNIQAPKQPKPLLQSESLFREEDFQTDPPPVTKEEMVVKYDANGQWSLTKDDSVKPFGQSVYNQTANLKRKATRTGEVQEGAGKNQAVRNYTTSGSSVQAAHEAAETKARKNNPSPPKIYTQEEKEAFAAKLKKSEDLCKAMGWSYNSSTGNFNHGLHGSVKVRAHENPSKGFEVVHNAKVISSHAPEDKAGAINSAATHMKGLSNASGSSMVSKGGLGQADENTVLKEEDSENKDPFGAGED